MMMTSEQVLETTHLLLRPMRPTDFDALWLIFTDPHVMAAFESPPLTAAQMQGWLQRNLDHQTEHGFGLFSIWHKEDGVLMGDCGLELMAINEEQVAELGYDLRSDYWGRGYATEAAVAVRDYAFQQLNLPRLVSLIRVGNDASRRVAEKVGMGLAAEFERYGRPYWQYELSRAEIG